jgi:hypothetical protein
MKARAGSTEIKELETAWAVHVQTARHTNYWYGASMQL